MWTPIVDAGGLALGAVVFLTLHVRHHGGDLKAIMAFLWSIDSKADHLGPSLGAYLIPREDHGNDGNDGRQDRKVQAEAALWEVHARTYRHAIQFMVHVAGFAVLGLLHAFYMDPSMQRLVQLLCLFSVYLTHHFVCKDKIALNVTNLRRLYTFLYMSFTLFVLTTPGEDGQRAVITQGFDVCSRMIMSVIFMDTLTTCPWQLAISLAEMGVHAMKHTWADTATFAWMQMTIFGCITTVSAVLEFWVSSHISVLLDTESMVSGFRRMLRGVSDGEVLLNEAMNICDETDCLKHLLMTQSNFKGKHFERLVVPKEIGRFRDFLKQSVAESHEIPQKRTKIPPCLRLSLRGASDLRVAVDVWHVLMPCRDGMRHLLALKEDGEAKTASFAPASPLASKMPKRALQKSLPSTSAGSSGSSASEVSTSQKSATSMLQNVSELVDMTLCVDATTNWFDIEQAHLSFRRQPQSSDSSMPSLRRLVRPTDWETVRSKLQKVTDPTGSKDLRLQLVDDAKRSIVAVGRVSMYTPPRSSEDSVKLCLQLTEMVLEDKSSRDWHLAAINE